MDAATVASAESVLARGFHMFKPIRILAILAIAILMTGAVACEAKPYVPPTPAYTAAPTPLATTGDFGVSRQDAFSSFKQLSIGLMPLNKHTNDWYSTKTRTGDITVDIFGPSEGVNAIEATFRLQASTLAIIDPLVRKMLQIAMGSQWREGETWVVSKIDDLNLTQKKLQTKKGKAWLTLYYLPSTESVMFSVDVERQ